MTARIALALAASITVTFVVDGADAKPDGEDPNACAHVDGKPVFNGSSFSHVVSVRNTCTATVQCSVWTNVDETHKAELQVPAHQQRQATLRDNSPVSLFRAESHCQFEAER